MKNKYIHLIYRQVGWAIRKEGNTRASRIFKSFLSALIFGFKLSRRNKTKLIIHKKDATVYKII